MNAKCKITHERKVLVPVALTTAPLLLGPLALGGPDLVGLQARSG